MSESMQNDYRKVELSTQLSNICSILTLSYIDLLLQDSIKLNIYVNVLQRTNVKALVRYG